MEKWSEPEIVKKQTTYYMFSTYCECGAMNCGPARGCGGRVSPYFPTKEKLIEWEKNQKDGRHSHNKRFWEIRTKIRYIK